MRIKHAGRQWPVRFLIGAGMSLVTTAVSAQSTVPLPDTSQVTTMTASVVEQARVTLPASATIDVDNVASSSGTGNLTVNVQNIVLSTATKQLRISVMANAASFTPPVSGATTWSADDLTWSNGPGGGPSAWQNASGSAGTLSSAVYTAIATCDADAATCSSTGFKFNLAAKPTVKRAGSHTLLVTWKFESIGS